jgi:hypothetical protein
MAVIIAKSEVGVWQRWLSEEEEEEEASSMPSCCMAQWEVLLWKIRKIANENE